MTKKGSKARVYAGTCMWGKHQGITKEDVFPRRIGRLIRETLQPPGTSVVQTYRTIKPDGSFARERRQVVGLAAGPRPLLTCVKCNGVWMQKMDDANWHLLRPMIIGDIPADGIPISSDDAKGLAAWVTKMGLVIDQAQEKEYGGTSHIGQDPVHWFFKYKRAFDNSSVHLGHYAWEPGDEVLDRFIEPLYDVDDADSAVRAIFISFRIGFMCVQWRADFSPESLGAPVREGGFDDALLKLFPDPAPSTWPPPEQFTPLRFTQFVSVHGGEVESPTYRLHRPPQRQDG